MDVTDKYEKEHQGWQVNHGLLSRREPRGSEPGNTAVVRVVADHAGIFANLNCVVSVFASSPAPVKFPVSERQAGRK